MSKIRQNMLVVGDENSITVWTMREDRRVLREGDWKKSRIKLIGDF